MFKSILVTLVLAPTMLFGGQVEFQCTGDDVEATLIFNYTEPAGPGHVSTRAQGKVVTPAGEQKLCTPFNIQKQFKRIGYLLDYEGTLPSGDQIYLAEESFQNEGPSDFSFGSYQAKGTTEQVALHCTKH